MIRNMNSIFMKHGRWLFALVTILIAVSFLGFLSPGFTGMFSGTRDPNSGAIGEAFGETITIEDIRAQNTRSMIIFSLIYKRPIGDRMLEQAASQNAFPAAIRLKAAKHLGIRISDEEVADFIGSEQTFQKDGKFDLELFDEYLEVQLKPLRLGPTDLDESVRDFLAQNALERLVVENIVTTPDEIDKFNQMFNQKIELTVANLKSEDFKKQVKISDDELDKYFKEHEAKYRIAERFNGLLAVFDFEPFQASDDKLKEYYETVKSEHLKDGKEQPFEAIKKELATEYNQKKSIEQTLRKGQMFASKAYEKSNAQPENERSKTFVELASKDKLRLTETGWFSADADKIGKLQEPALINEFREITGVITNAVPGKDAIYVGFLLNKEDSRQAQFAEVKEQVRKELTDQKALELARQKARDIVKKMAQAKDNVIEMAKKEPHFTIVPAYTMMAPPQIADSNYILQQAENLNSGGFSPAIDTPTGALVVVMLKRSAPSDKELEEKRSIAEYIFKQNKSNAASASFNAWLQANTKEFRRQ